METALAPPVPRRALLDGVQGLGRRISGRMRHLVYATLIALALMTLGVLDPLSQFNWLVQSKLGGQKPSGEIVFVGAAENLDDPRLGHRRADLARALDELERRGVGKVYLDLAFEEPSQPRYDAELARAIRALGPRVVLADQLELDPQGDAVLRRTIPEIAGGTERVVSEKQDRNYFGIKWVANYRADDGERLRPTLGAALGGYGNHPQGLFQIDYGFRAADLPALALDDVLRPERTSALHLDLAGKSVVIGYTRAVDRSPLVIPNGLYAPPSYVPIFAGESLRSGRTGAIAAEAVISILATLLAALILLNSSRRRRWLGYAVITLAIPLALVVAARLGVRIETANAIALCVIYALFRSRTRWKEWVALVNQETGIPRLRALETRLARERVANGHVVIAKLHNYERVLKTLRREDRASYIVKIIDRLRAADPSLAIYNDGHHLGWFTSTDETQTLIDHLEGLRAIFAAPVVVNGQSIDVDITFGLAAIQGDAAGRIVSAIAAAEETNEALEPIKAAEAGSQSDLMWDISLRARIDEAMELGEIYCVYQPKIATGTGAVDGVEALVRWHDPARGFIQPTHFIRQCEKAGRMEQLTRYVLQSACSAGKLLHFRGRALHMSVNISATLLSDRRIVGNVRNVLQATQFDPKYLVLEITETARIADLAAAAKILDELRGLGVRISIDDFGVGAANFETFFLLPFDELKIDRLFVSSLPRSEKARAMVASIVAMGKAARITIVAEGAETAQEVDILNKMGCDLIQGYYFSRPISLSNLLEFNVNQGGGRIANMV